MDIGDWQEQTPNAFETLVTAMEELYQENPELSLRVKEELAAAARGEENILLVGTDGEFSVTILYLDSEVLEPGQTITLFPTSSSVAILAAVSRETIEAKFRMCEAMVDDGEVDMADQMWDEFMQDMMIQAVAMHRENPRNF